MSTEEFFRLFNAGQLPSSCLDKAHLHLSEATRDALEAGLNSLGTPFARQLALFVGGAGPADPLQVGRDNDCVQEIKLVSDTLFDRVTEQQYDARFREWISWS